MGETLWHSSMNQTGCLILYSRTCVALHMRHHSQQMIIMLLINLDDSIKWRYGSFSDLLVWRIGLRKVRIFWSVIYYSTIYPRLLDRWDRILYNYMSWLHIIPHGHAHPLFNNVNNLSILLPIPFSYAMKSYDVFQKVPCVWAQCLNMLKYTSIILKMISCWIIIQHFHFKLLELNLNVHLCFNYIVLI